MPIHRSIIAVAALAVLTACSSDKDSAAESARSEAARPADAQTATTPTGEESAPAIAFTPGTAAPITGAIIEVRLIGDASGYRFDPQHVTAKPGDGVKFVVLSGGPHEVAFDLDAVPPASRTQLQVNMPNSADGRSPILAGVQETWTVSLGGLEPGRYPFVSTPRLPQGMKGEIEIR